MNAPLADQMRPQTIDEVVGQSHILSKNGILYRIAQSGHATNLIFYGPPGTGKTRSEERRVGKECRSRWSPYQSRLAKSCISSTAPPPVPLTLRKSSLLWTPLKG